MRSLYPLFLTTLLAVGCMPKTQLQVLDPAEIAVPQHIQTVAVVDKSQPATTGDKILGVVEGVLTGEEIGADQAGRAAALQGLTGVLAASPRFEGVIPGPSVTAPDGPIPWGTLQDMCANLGCQGVVALEGFDSDSRYLHNVETETQTEENGREVKVQVHEVRRETTVLTAWRLYDVENTRVLDARTGQDSTQTWSEEGKTEDGAKAKLPSQSEATQSVGRDSGQSYGRRIAPSWRIVRRAWYAKGSDDLKAAAPLFKAGNRAGAAELWLKAAQDPDPAVAGRAKFNLAVLKEVEGDLIRAVEFSSDAAATLDKRRAWNYHNTLQVRLADQVRLREQLGE